MTPSDKPTPRAATVADLKAASLPPWSAGYSLQTRSDGRGYLYAEVDGCHIWAQPKAWSTMTFTKGEAAASPEAGATNYGIELGQMQARAGHIETNDPRFGEQFGSVVGRESPLPDLSPRSIAQAPGVIHVFILALGIVLAALILRTKRKAG